MPRTGTTRRTILAATLRDGAESASSVVSRLGQSAGYALRRLPRWRPIQPPSRPRDLFGGSLDAFAERLDEVQIQFYARQRLQGDESLRGHDLGGREGAGGLLAINRDHAIGKIEQP